MKLRIRLCVCVLVAVLARVSAAEYFVGLDGSDANDGLSRETAFATVQRGVDALQPGDTLTIGPGEYREAVSRANLGSMDAETIIRAEIPGTAVLRGDVPAPRFRKLEGYRFVYVADFDDDREARVVNELDTLTVLQAMPNISEVDFSPGTFHHDAKSRRLYISTLDTRHPDTHRYTVSVIPRDGLHLANARRVVVEGIAATGFNISGFGGGGSGIMLRDATESVIRDCHAWLNGWGIQASAKPDGTGSNVIERCVAWGNDSPFGNDRRGGISAFRHRGDIIRDSLAFLNANCGIYLRIDADTEIASRLEDNMAWGNRWNFIIKGNAGGVNTSERNVEGVSATGPDAGRINPVHNLLLSGNPGAQEAPGTITVEEEKDLDFHSEFADPDNRDYRLQATSRFRGAGPNGNDRGPFQYKANIFYVRPDGDDRADGLSAENAWRTLSRGVRDLSPGDTLYLGAGVYRQSIGTRLRGEQGSAVSIRGRGHGPVVIAGTVRLGDSRRVEFRRLRFEAPVQVNDSADIAFDNCEFAQAPTSLEASGVGGLRVTHSGFADFEQAAVALRNCQNAHLSGNLFDNRLGAAIQTDAAEAVRYSDYNAYRDGGTAWIVDGVTLALDGVRGGNDRYSEALPREFAPTRGGVLLHERSPVVAAGPMGLPFGPYRAEPRRVALRLTTEPATHSVSATTANIEWTTYLPCQVHLAWGPTPALENTDVFETDYFGTYSLAGLEPGRTYYFQIKELRENQRVLGQHEVTRLGTFEVVPTELDSPMISFTTTENDPEPTVYYVAPDGDNSNTGRDRGNAWLTIQHAAGQVKPGDTVLIAGGEYEEQVRVRATGAAGTPITFRCTPGEKVVISGGDAELNDAFAVNAKHHLRFDGMYLLSMWFNLYKSSDIEISRIFAGRYSRGYAPGFVNALKCRDVTIRNSVALSAKGGPKFFGCDNLRIENNVFYRNMIGQLLIEPMPGQRTLVANNIFTDGLQKKGSAPMFYLGRYDAFEERNNCYYPRPDRWHEKPIAMVYSDFAFDRSRIARNMGEVQHPHPRVDEILRLNFTEMQEYIGETDSVLGNPEFKGLADIPDRNEDGDPIYRVDRMTGTGPISMENFFATNPEIVSRGIGLHPEAFADFHFNAE